MKIKSTRRRLPQCVLSRRLRTAMEKCTIAASYTSHMFLTSVAGIPCNISGRNCHSKTRHFVPLGLSDRRYSPNRRWSIILVRMFKRNLCWTFEEKVMWGFSNVTYSHCVCKLHLFSSIRFHLSMESHW